MFAKKAGWAALVVLVVGAGTAYTGCTSVYDEVNNVLQGGAGGIMTCTSECCAPEDCPDTGNPCIARTCTEGSCGTENLADGTPSLEQTEGDCKVEVCDGNGGTIQMFEPPGTPCTAAGGNICTATGQCVECLSDADCADPNPICTGNKCVPETCTDGRTNGTETDTDCGGGTCASCDTDKICASDADCFHGKCGGDKKCAAPTCNDGIQNGGEYLTGQGGETDIDCAGPCPTKCGPEKGCNQNADCIGGECTGVSGKCIPNCMDGVVNNQEVGVDCGGGTCAGCPIGGPCAGSDANCEMGAYCATDVCTAKKPPGATCTAAKECSIGTCDQTDKVCCDKMCGGTCESCKLAGNAGTCLPAPAGTDPDNECNDPTVCNGSGACKAPVGAACANAVDCALGFCADGFCCNEACTDVCKACDIGAPGACVEVPAGMEDPGTCDADNEACGTIGIDVDCVDPGAFKKLGEFCTTGIQCFGSLVCHANECKLPIGAPCTEATKDTCISYRCVDNKCASCANDGINEAEECPETDCTAPGYCTYPLGHACNANGQCYDNLVCRGAACKLPIGAPCTEATKDNCVSYRCVNNECATCTDDGVDEEAECPGTDCTAGNRCSYESGHPCNAHNQCFTGSCTNNVCQ